MTTVGKWLGDCAAKKRQWNIVSFRGRHIECEAVFNSLGKVLTTDAGPSYLIASCEWLSMKRPNADQSFGPGKLTTRPKDALKLPEAAKGLPVASTREYESNLCYILKASNTLNSLTLVLCSGVRCRGRLGTCGALRRNVYFLKWAGLRPDNPNSNNRFDCLHKHEERITIHI